MLTIVKSCIKGYKFLYTWAGILQANILIDNIIMSKYGYNISWQIFIINCNITIKKEENKPLKVQNKTKMSKFIAIVFFFSRYSFGSIFIIMSQIKDSELIQSLKNEITLILKNK